MRKDLQNEKARKRGILCSFLVITMLSILGCDNREMANSTQESNNTEVRKESAVQVTEPKERDLVETITNPTVTDERTGKTFPIVDGQVEVMLPISVNVYMTLNGEPRSSWNTTYSYSENGLLLDEHHTDTGYIWGEDVEYTDNYNETQLIYSYNGMQVSQVNRLVYEEECASMVEDCLYRFEYSGDHITSISCLDNYDGMEFFSSSLTFDETSGFITGINEEGVRMVYNNICDENGNLTNIQYALNYDNDPSCNMQKEGFAKYDNQGMLIEASFMDPSDIHDMHINDTTFQYDEKGHLINVLSRGDIVPHLPSESQYIYDSAGNLSAFHIYGHNTEKNETDYIHGMAFTYDDNGRGKQVDWLSAEDGEVFHSDIFEYDEYDNLVRISYDVKGEICSVDVQYGTFYIAQDAWELYRDNYYYTYRWSAFQLQLLMMEKDNVIAQNEGYGETYSVFQNISDAYFYSDYEMAKFSWMVYIPKIVNNTLLKNYY